jgi:hypothetical protein
VPTIRKSIAAALTGIASWGVTAHPDGIDGLEWWGLFGVLVGAFLVWLTPNEPATVSASDRLRELGLHDDLPTTGAPDAGQGSVSGVVWLIVGLLLVIVLLRYLGWVG